MHARRDVLELFFHRQTALSRQAGQVCQRRRMFDQRIEAQFSPLPPAQDVQEGRIKGVLEAGANQKIVVVEGIGEPTKLIESPDRKSDAIAPVAPSGDSRLKPVSSRPSPKFSHQTSCHCRERKRQAISDSARTESHFSPWFRNEVSALAGRVSCCASSSVMFLFPLWWPNLRAQPWSASWPRLADAPHGHAEMFGLDFDYNYLGLQNR